MRREKWCWSSCVCVWAYLHLVYCVYQCTHSGANMHPPISCSFPAAPALCPHTDHPELPLLIPRTSLSPLLTDLTSPLTPASLLKLEAPVITTLSSTQPLNTPHSAFPIPLSSCPRFGSQSSTSGMNFAEVLWCWNAFWFYSISTWDWRRGRVNDTCCILWWRSEVDVRWIDGFKVVDVVKTYLHLLLIIIYWKCNLNLQKSGNEISVMSDKVVWRALLTVWFDTFQAEKYLQLQISVDLREQFWEMC